MVVVRLGLKAPHGLGRGNTLHEERWYNPTNKELCVFELWYRRWEQANGYQNA